MSTTVRPAPSLVPAVLALIVLAGLGYLLFADLHPSRTEHTVNPPIEIVQPELEQVTIEPAATTVDQQLVMEQDAETFVDQLGSGEEDNSTTVTENRGEFVRHDGNIVLPMQEQRTTTIQALLDDKTLSPSTSLTLQYVETIKRNTTLRQLAVETEDQMAIVTLELEDGSTIRAPLAELLGAGNIDADAPVTLITQVEHNRQLTLAELATLGLPPTLQVTATIDQGVESLSMKELIRSAELPDNALFYLHRVTEQDRQGLWGIIQNGLIERFREGLSLEGISANRDRVQVTIPADADEPLPTGLSSFLGKLLSQKVESSYIYNFNTRSMGHDPNLIYPGQQLIMIHFAPDELKQIYLFFAEQRNERAQSFAVQP